MDEEMKFSIIIPTYNRPQKILYLLEAMRSQKYDRQLWEVIVVDDGSPSRIREEIENLCLDYSWNYYYQTNSGPAAARNLGATKAKGKYLVFIDDDCEADHNLLSTICKNASPGTLYGGKIINKLENNIYSEASQLLIDYLYFALLNTHMMFFTSNNLFIDKESFVKAGSFSHDFQTAAGEDREFSIRFHHLGYLLEYCPDAVVYHMHDLTFTSFCRQHFNYGRASNPFSTIMKQLNINPYLKNSFFYSNLLVFPLTKKKYSFYKRILLLSLLGVSQLSYFTGIIAEKINCTKYISSKPHPEKQVL